MIDILLHSARDMLTILTIVSIYGLVIWVIAACVGFSDRDERWP